MLKTGSSQSAELQLQAQEIAVSVDELSSNLDEYQMRLRFLGMDLPQEAEGVIESLKAQINGIEEILASDDTELAQMRMLIDLPSVINVSSNVDMALKNVLDAVVDLVHANHGSILLWDSGVNPSDDFDNVRIIATFDDELTIHQIGVQKSILEQVLRTKETAVGETEVNTLDESGSALYIPLLHKETVVGVVYVDTSQQSGFTERDVRLLTAFANIVAVAVSNARLYARVQQLLAETTQVKELMDNIFASIASGLITVDEQLEITMFNTSAEKIFDIFSKDVIGKPFQTIFPLLPDVFHGLEHVMSQGESIVLGTEWLDSDRENKALNIRMSPLVSEGEHGVGAAIVVDDVTSEARHENRIRIMKQYLPEKMVEQIDEISSLGMGGERREITCAFLELLPVSDSYNNELSEIFVDTINRKIKLVHEIVQANGGIVDKTISTELLILFNTQLNPCEDHAFRTLKTILEIQREIATVRSTNDAIYAGAHTGIATLGNVGTLKRREFTAIGYTVNLCKRIAEFAVRKNQILVSETCLGHAEISLSDEQKHAPPWMTEPMPDFQISGGGREIVLYEFRDVKQLG